MKKRAHLLIGGLVQGVFFRATAREEAARLGLTGWAQNRPDGKVEIVAEGEECSLATFIDWCRNGPPYARVDEVVTEHSDATGEFCSFGVRH